MHNPKNKRAYVAFKHAVQNYCTISDPIRTLEIMNLMMVETNQRPNPLTPADWQEIGALHQLLIEFLKIKN